MPAWISNGLTEVSSPCELAIRSECGIRSRKKSPFSLAPWPTEVLTDHFELKKTKNITNEKQVAATEEEEDAFWSG